MCFSMHMEFNIRSINLQVGDGSVQFSPRWLLYQLIAHLDSYMMHKCAHNKFGTVLYRKEGNVLVALSWALSASQPFITINMSLNTSVKIQM